MVRIPDEIYEQILEHSVISAVDGIILHNGKVLLAYRTQKPAKGRWWIPGGRQLKGEKPEDTIKRKIQKEVGLNVEVKKFVGVCDQSFEETAFPNVKTGVHYIARVYLVELKDETQEVKLDETQEEYKWIDKIEPELHDYVKTSLRDSGVFEAE